jgi:DNA-binding CsgD family transcriptional regulator
MTQMVQLSDEVRALLSDVQAHAAACGRLDCGHLGRSTSGAVRRAVYLYQCEGAGMVLNLNRVSADVAAVLGVLRESRHARPTYVRAGRSYRAAVAGMTTVLPDPWGIKITPQRRDVFQALIAGKSATEVSREQHRALETVKSHMGYLRRLTGAHDSHSALIALVLAGRLADRAVTVPEEVAIPAPDATEE